MHKLTDYTNYAWTAFTLEELDRLERVADWEPYVDPHDTPEAIPSGTVEYCLVQAERATYYFRSLTSERMCKVDASMFWDCPDNDLAQALGIIALCDVALFFAQEVAS